MLKFNPDYYARVLQEHWYDKMVNEVAPITFELWNLTRQEIERLRFCHHHGDVFAKQARIDQSTTKVITGIWLSWTPHLWTLSQMTKAIRLQKDAWLAVKFVLWDLDAANGKWTPLQEARDLAKKTKDFMLGIWFDDTGRNELLPQYDELEILRTTYLSWFFMDDWDFDGAEEDLHWFYAEQWKVDNSMSFRRRLSLALMVGWWYYQQLEKGEKHILVTLWIDEHVYVRFWQKVLEKMKASSAYWSKLEWATISWMYSTLIGWLNEYPKMSKSFPNSWITLDMSHDTIRRLILDEKKREENPENDVILQCMTNASTLTLQELQGCTEAWEKWWQRWSSAKLMYAENLWKLIKWRNSPISH